MVRAGGFAVSALPMLVTTAATAVRRRAVVFTSHRRQRATASPPLIPRPTPAGDHSEVELVYFNILARGELVRLCYAAHAAAGGQQQFKDTRLPFFMDSEANRRLCDEVHRPAAPFAFFPYLRVRDLATGSVQALSGDGVIEGFVARRLGLVGADEMEAAVCLSIAHAALSPCSPPLTGAGLRGDSEWICGSVQPTGSIGTTLTQLEHFVKKCHGRYLVGGGLTIVRRQHIRYSVLCATDPRATSLRRMMCIAVWRLNCRLVACRLVASYAGGSQYLQCARRVRARAAW
jgi:hypothetical protein